MLPEGRKNAQKQQAAKLLMNIREKYTLDPSAEYMKETTAISQMIQEMEENLQAEQALTTTGLDDWLQDLKAKNEAFLAKMNERTEAQVVFANHPYLKKAKEDIEEMVKPKDNPKTAFIGQQFTDLEMADPDGKMHKVSELVDEGKYVLVDFWASWCGPCRAEMPNVLEAYNKYHDKGFEVVGISFDNKKDAWVKAVGQLNLPWLQLSDLKGWQCAAAPIYKIDAIPDNILIDPQGNIIDRALRGKSLHNRLQQIFDKQ